MFSTTFVAIENGKKNYSLLLKLLSLGQQSFLVQGRYNIYLVTVSKSDKNIDAYR